MQVKAAGTPSPGPAVLATVRHSITNGWEFQAEYTATIFEDGTVRYVRSAVAPIPAKKLSREQLAQLVATFEKANYFHLKDSYPRHEVGGDVGPLPEDMEIAYTRNGRTKKVTHARDANVPGLSEMEVRIEEILGTQGWIAGPKY